MSEILQVLQSILVERHKSDVFFSEFDIRSINEITDILLVPTVKKKKKKKIENALWPKMVTMSGTQWVWMTKTIDLKIFTLFFILNI